METLRHLWCQHPLGNIVSQLRTQGLGGKGLGCVIAFGIERGQLLPHGIGGHAAFGLARLEQMHAKVCCLPARHLVEHQPELVGNLGVDPGPAILVLPFQIGLAQLCNACRPGGLLGIDPAGIPHVQRQIVGVPQHVDLKPLHLAIQPIGFEHRADLHEFFAQPRHTCPPVRGHEPFPGHAWPAVGVLAGIDAGPGDGQPAHASNCGQIFGA